MKNILPILLCAILFASCRREETTEPQNEYCVLSIPKDNGERYKERRPPNFGGPVTGLNVQPLLSVQYGASLKWNRYSKKYYQYKIYRSQVSGFTPGPQTYIGVANFELYNDSPLQSLTTYYYKVTHVDRNGNESTPSNEVPYTTQSEPIGMTSVIFIDFDGHTITDPNNIWVMYNGGNPLTVRPTLLSPNQQVDVVAYFVEKYAPFNVDIVTTEAAYQAANPYKRSRVVYTPDYSFYALAGGVAVVGSFTSGREEPAFIFDSLLYLNQRYVERAGVHEGAHTLWCRHHYKYKSDDPNSPDYCTVESSYHPGENNVARIMGNPYNYDQAIFTIGRTWICNVMQNDNQVINQTLN